MRRIYLCIILLPTLLLADSDQYMLPPLELANRAHVQPLELESNDYEEALKIFLGQLDPRRLILAESDVEKLQEIEEQNRGKASLRFLREIQIIFSKRVREAIATLRSMESAKYSNVNEEFDLGDSDFVEEQDLRRRWEQLIQFETLKRLYLHHLPGSSAEYITLLNKHGQKTRNSVIQAQIQSLSQSLNPPEGLGNFLYFLYCRSLLSRFDPHSAVLSQSDMERFQRSLSTSGKSFGLVFRSTPLQEIEVTRVIPGGSAWKSGRVNTRDVVIEVHLPQTDEQYYGSDLGASELQDRLASSNARSGVFKIRKPDGRLIQVRLFKEELRLEQNIVSGFVLKGKRKLGYIYLPSFYQSWESEELPASASDVAAEIVKLKREGIQGLILDLRNNGGGSLREAADLCGLFIDSGPLFFGVHGDQIEVFKDPNRGAVYRDPLLVLVNEQSASASEFFAGTMKDYNRAIIVGRRTFGKATAQRLLPFRDPVVRSPAYLNITTGIFYNLHGRSHQGTGVVPHISLPEFSPFIYRESDLPAVLDAREIEKRLPYEKAPDLPLDQLRSLSEDRMDASEGFRIVASLMEDLEPLRSMPDSVSLDPEEFYVEMLPIRKALEAGDRAGNYTASAYKAYIQRFDLASQSVDPYAKQLYSERLEQLQGDPYLEESFYILSDYIQMIEK